MGMPRFHISCLGPASPPSPEETQDAINGTLGTATETDQEEDDDASNDTNHDARNRPAAQLGSLCRRFGTNENASVSSDWGRKGNSRGSCAGRGHREDSIAGWSYWNAGDLSESEEAAVVCRTASIGSGTLVDVCLAILPSRATRAATGYLSERVSTVACRRGSRGGENLILRGDGKE